MMKIPKADRPILAIKVLAKCGKLRQHNIFEA
jgi:hypothetical protein